MRPLPLRSTSRAYGPSAMLTGALDEASSFDEKTDTKMVTCFCPVLLQVTGKFNCMMVLQANGGGLTEAECCKGFGEDGCKTYPTVCYGPQLSGLSGPDKACQEVRISMRRGVSACCLQPHKYIRAHRCCRLCTKGLGHTRQRYDWPFPLE
jgi:hypothetical protein